MHITTIIRHINALCSAYLAFPPCHLQQHPCLTSDPSPMKLSEAQRQLIAELYKQKVSINSIAARVNCSPKTASKWAHRGQEPNPSFADAARSGRPKTLQQSERSKARRMASHNKTVGQITSSINKQRQQPTSSHPVRQALTNSRSPLLWAPVNRGRVLSPVNKSNGLAFCKRHKRSQRGAWVYGDSKFYYMYKDGAGKVHCRWRTLQQQAAVVNTGDPIVMHFYGFVGKNYKSDLYFVAPTPAARSKARKGREAFASKHFISLLPKVKRDLVKGGKYSRRNPIVLDHAKQHSSRMSQAAISHLQLHLVENFPAQSWDINIIENVWGVLDSKLAAMGGRLPTTPYGWRIRVKRAWDSISQSTINKLVADVPNRMARVVQQQGAWLYKKGTK